MTTEVLSSLPEWLTENYLSDVLHKGNKSSLTTKILHVTSASEQGDNYLGTVFRMVVVCNNVQKCLIVKIMPSETEGSKPISSLGVYERERDMYYKVLPKVYNVMKEKLGQFEYFSPYCYITTRTDAIILEDLKPLGYHMADRKKQLDMDHALLVLSTLAKLHAFSYIMGPESIKHYHDIFFSKENRNLNGGLLASIFKSLCRTVSEWEGYEEYASSLWNFSDSVVDRFNDVVEPTEGSFCVLTHGDCWTNNFLFRYCPETGKVMDMKLIDYQLGRYASPALDLIYFFYSSLQLDVWKQQYRLLKHYHDELTKWLTTAGSSAKAYTFQDLQADMNSKLVFALATTSTVSAIALADSGDGPDLEKLFHENSETHVSQFHKAHNTDQFREKLQVFLKYFEKEGLLS
ncbi:uncharacterized protein LOC134541595 [Bacillus rossius redtenbacheri]|uniref:uncharacterized protein LOC134541595 n=1 Tax=Bacillus rossius redtenbacheri TaxID=93214 RepID=UPI002FDD2C4D